MIIKEELSINNKEFIKTYSDEGKLIKKVGTDETYESAIDLPELSYIYEETDIEIIIKGEEDGN